MAINKYKTGDIVVLVEKIMGSWYEHWIEVGTHCKIDRMDSSDRPYHIIPLGDGPGGAGWAQEHSLTYAEEPTPIFLTTN